MPSVPATDETVVALMVSDLHLSDKVPVARSAEADWELAQIVPLKQLAKYQRRYNCPVLIAGDILDKPVVLPWVVNMALKHLPEQCYAVPGQHDMPHHNYSDIRKSAYWTLVEAGKIVNLEPGHPTEVMSNGRILRLRGFPWGVPAVACSDPHDMALEIAVVHDYLWTTPETCYKDAPEIKQLSKRFAQFKGYDAVVVGDNHIHWMIGSGRPKMYNCGCFQRRRADEKQHQPMVGLLFADGTIKRKKLDTSAEKWIDNAADAERVMGGSSAEFVKELEALGDAALDYAAAVKRRLIGVHDEQIKAVVLRCLEGK